MHRFGCFYRLSGKPQEIPSFFSEIAMANTDHGYRNRFQIYRAIFECYHFLKYLCVGLASLILVTIGSCGLRTKNKSSFYRKMADVSTIYFVFFKAILQRQDLYVTYMHSRYVSSNTGLTVKTIVQCAAKSVLNFIYKSK